MRPTEKEAREVIKKSLAPMKNSLKSNKRNDHKTSLYKTSIEAAIRFCKKALQTEGLEFKNLCLYVIGNAIYWDGEGSAEMKERLRKFSFSGAIKYRPKIDRGLTNCLPDLQEAENNGEI